MRISKSRPYRMTRRAELVEETRQRITAAAARLHTTIGPANTSIAAIADEAGVTRLTVYHHFPDLDVLFQACRAHWRAQNPPPDARRWAETTALEARARRALTELYSWFRDHAEELFPIYRDLTASPLSSQRTTLDDIRGLARLLLAGDAPDGDAGRPMRAVASHLVDYRTWRSLAIDQELTDPEVVELGVRLLTVLAAATKSVRRSSPATRSATSTP